MKIVFLSHYFSPHIGGVEKHVLELSKALIKKGHQVTVVTQNYDNLKDIDMVDKIKIIRFSYPKKKFIGLIFIWIWFWQNRNILLSADIIHIHDVFIWYLPFRFIFPSRKVYLTIHGLEWNNPFSMSGILQKKLALKLSKKSIGIGKFLEKYLSVKFDTISYGATNIPKNKIKKRKKIIVFVGRLARDTGVIEFLNYLKKHKNLKAVFIGDGDYKNQCQKYGEVRGFTNSQKFIENAGVLVPGGYLTCLEGFAAKCKIKIFISNDLKRDYWQLSPMYKFIKDDNIKEAYNWVKNQTWEKLADEYLNLYNSTK